MKSSIELTQPLPESCEYLVIDGDTIAYMIGWHHRDHTDEALIKHAVDQWLKDFFAIAGMKYYIGVLAPNNSSNCFRKNIYKYKPYKGNRTEKEEWIKFWEPIIRQHLADEWWFTLAPNHLETDDVVAAIVEGNPKAVLCSPDKDLKQIPGFHLNYKQNTEDSPLQVDIIEYNTAKRNLWTQVLTGDTTDNVNGITGMGEAKAKKLLDETQQLLWENAVQLAYQKQYGPYYGPIIFTETYNTIRLMTPSHPLWDSYKFDVESYKQNHLKEVPSAVKYAGPFYSETE